jgi:hypothetical protein
MAAAIASAITLFMISPDHVVRTSCVRTTTISFLKKFNSVFSGASRMASRDWREEPGIKAQSTVRWRTQERRQELDEELFFPQEKPGLHG